MWRAYLICYKDCQMMNDAVFTSKHPVTNTEWQDTSLRTVLMT